MLARISTPSTTRCARNDHWPKSLMRTLTVSSSTSVVLLLTAWCTLFSALGSAVWWFIGDGRVRGRRERSTTTCRRLSPSMSTLEALGSTDMTPSRSHSSMTSADQSSSWPTCSNSLIGIQCGCRSKGALYLGRLGRYILRVTRILRPGFRTRTRNTCKRCSEDLRT